MRRESCAGTWRYGCRRTGGRDAAKATFPKQSAKLFGGAWRGRIPHMAPGRPELGDAHNMPGEVVADTPQVRHDAGQRCMPRVRHGGDLHGVHRRRRQASVFAPVRPVTEPHQDAVEGYQAPAGRRVLRPRTNRNVIVQIIQNEKTVKAVEYATWRYRIAEFRVGRGGPPCRHAAWYN